MRAANQTANPETVSKPRAVMDTNVLVAAFRSRTGASFEIFQRLRRDEWTAILSNHLLKPKEFLARLRQSK